MRNGGQYATAVRQPDGTILVEVHPWYTFTKNPLLELPFLRGFPILLETLINGIKALNSSVAVALADSETPPDSSEKMGGTIFISVILAIGLFIVIPHLLSFLMNSLGFGGDVESFSFHFWDGLFKFIIFIGYITAISFLPDIRRVFQYHGAEHKVIHAFEEESEVSAESAKYCSRLHPRCGTTFLLFVLSIAILLHALLVPLFLMYWTPQNGISKHIVILLFKLFLMIPISNLAYELIRYAARMGDSFFGKLLRAPGLFLQMLTTDEPDKEQLEVAVAALGMALEKHDRRTYCLKMPHVVCAENFRAENF